MTIRKPTPDKTTKARTSCKRELTIFEKIVERAKRIPPEELARHPRDGAANLEHYLYGAPRQESWW